ncbi:MAG: SDR family NAD(P)-dependent oxidoreductase [Pseudomonadota bacterium]|nr:SDR family NAD(P)-dependent oxidoreductase [Pseudomonadota bacterium]
MLKNKNQSTNLNVFITGHTSGLGLAIAKHYLDHNATVFGLSRNFSERKHPRLHEEKLDLSDNQDIEPALEALKLKNKSLEVLFLNAAELGPISPLKKLKLDVLKKTMDTNVWSNKMILDWFLKFNHVPKQIVLISSGASKNANYGWGAYAISKSCLNMIAKLYAHEFPDSHISAVAPGLIDTKMQALIRKNDGAEFPSLKKMFKAYEDNLLPTPEKVATTLIKRLKEISQLDSGSYIDLRHY